MNKLKTIAPVLQVRDVRKSSVFYMEVLGFGLNFAVSDARRTLQALEEDPDATLVYAQLAQNGVEVMLQSAGHLDAEDAFLQGGRPGDPAVSFYFLTEDADALYAEVRDRAETVAAPRTAWYGMREFFIRDPDGYILGFAHSAEEQDAS